jgi:hypothetical protein
VFLFMRIDGDYRDVVVHGPCYEPDRLSPMVSPVLPELSEPQGFKPGA